MFWWLFTLALAAPTVDDARTVFERYIALEQAFDPALGTLLADDATLRATRDGQVMEMTGAQYKASLGPGLAAAKAAGEVDTYAEVKVAADGAGFRVSAHRTSAAKCTTDKTFSVRLEERDGKLLIVESQQTVAGLPQCPASPELAATLAAVKDTVSAKLPLQLDADTRLDRVDVQHSALIYGMTLVTVGGPDLDLTQLRPALGQLAVSQVCVEGGPLQPISAAGATVRYVFTLNDGRVLAPLDISPAMCARFGGS